LPNTRKLNVVSLILHSCMDDRRELINVMNMYNASLV
jgi:hypothetical protein